MIFQFRTIVDKFCYNSVAHIKYKFVLNGTFIGTNNNGGCY